MAFIDFIKAAGEKLFHTGSASAAPQSSGTGQSAAESPLPQTLRRATPFSPTSNRKTSTRPRLTVTYDSGTEVVTVYGGREGPGHQGKDHPCAAATSRMFRAWMTR